MNALLSLRPIARDNQSDCVAILINDQLKQTYMLPDFDSDREAEQLFNRLVTLSLQNDRYVRGIYLDDKLIGFINDTEICGLQIELGWALHPDYHGYGYATQALRMAIIELFGLGYTVITAGAFSSNIASIRVMEKAGMQRYDKTDDIVYRGAIHTCVFYRISP